MDDCFLHYESVNTSDKLLCLSNVESWLTILNAARIRNHEKVLELNESLPDGEFPQIKFHKSFSFPIYEHGACCSVHINCILYIF